MSTLIEFLIENPVDNLTEKVIVSDRLKNFPFTVKAMTGPEFQKYQSAAIAIGKKNKVNFDTKKFNELVVLNQVIEPCFRSAENLQKAGCSSPEEFLYKSLLAGEIAELSTKISSLSGFDKDEEQLAEEVKNV